METTSSTSNNDTEAGVVIVVPTHYDHGQEAPQDDTEEMLRDTIRSIILSDPYGQLLYNEQDEDGDGDNSNRNSNQKALLWYPSSLQYTVIEWLVHDPQLHQYSESKIIQRYALGCFYMNLQEGTITNDHVLQTWMSYDDECTTWASTETKTKTQQTSSTTDTTSTTSPNGMCRSSSSSNSDGQQDQQHIVSIHLEDVGLNGTLVDELILLSDSLGKIFFFVPHFFLKERK